MTEHKICGKCHCPLTISSSKPKSFERFRRYRAQNIDPVHRRKITITLKLNSFKGFLYKRSRTSIFEYMFHEGTISMSEEVSEEEWQCSFITKCTSMSLKIGQRKRRGSCSKCRSVEFVENVSDRTVLCPRFVRLVEQDMRLKRRTTPVPDPVVSSAHRPTLADSL